MSSQFGQGWRDVTERSNHCESIKKKSRFVSESLITRGHIAESNTRTARRRRGFRALQRTLKQSEECSLDSALSHTHRWSTRRLLTDTVPEPLVSEDEARFFHTQVINRTEQSSCCERRCQVLLLLCQVNLGVFSPWTTAENDPEAPLLLDLGDVQKPH